MDLSQKNINAKMVELEQELKSSKLECQQLNKQLSMLSTIHKQKTELVNNIKTELIKLEKSASSNEFKSVLGRLIREIDFNDSMRNNWDFYSNYFEKGNQDFIEKISKEFPTLTSRDHRLCLYLKMNLTTKEIAPLMNISVRGVEISRYRLRKKLNLTPHEKLNQFLKNL
ncbi:MAG: hypothetical protein AAFZ15_28140 [Bacteroidota bacterium]